MIMKIRLLFIVFIFLCLNGYSQESILVKEKRYIGYVFNEEHFVFMSIDNQKERYTPTEENIIQAERIINDNIEMKKYCHLSINRKKLKKYKRQYVGFKTNNGDVVIWINFLRDKDIGNVELSKDIITVLDGGKNYWSVFVNLTRGTFYGLRINGIS